MRTVATLVYLINLIKYYVILSCSCQSLKPYKIGDKPLPSPASWVALLEGNFKIDTFKLEKRAVCLRADALPKGLILSIEKEG